MAASDLRVSMAPMVDAFGLPIVVTRPAPDDEPIATVGLWISSSDQDKRGAQPLDEVRPIGSDFQRREPRKVLAVPRDAVLTKFPRGSFIQAADALGGTVRTWRTDGFDRVEPDVWRVIVVPVADL